MKNFLILFLYLILIFGCYPEKDGSTLINNQPIHPKFTSVFIDPSFTEEELIIINDGLNQWQESTGFYINWKIKNWKNRFTENSCIQSGLIIIKTHSESAIVKEIEKEIGFKIAGYHFGKKTKCSRDVILIVADRKIHNKKNYLIVVLHELGHVLGLDHTSHTSVMSYNSMYNLQQLTQYDIESFFKKEFEKKRN